LLAKLALRITQPTVAIILLETLHASVMIIVVIEDLLLIPILCAEAVKGRGM
jgi:hypothetical protein